MPYQPCNDRVAWCNFSRRRPHLRRRAFMVDVQSKPPFFGCKGVRVAVSRIARSIPFSLRPAPNPGVALWRTLDSPTDCNLALLKYVLLLQEYGTRVLISCYSPPPANSVQEALYPPSSAPIRAKGWMPHILISPSVCSPSQRL